MTVENYSVAVVLAAGRGSRMNSPKPKWLLDVGDSTIAQLQLQGLRHVPELFIVTGYRSDLIAQELESLTPIVQTRRIQTVHNKRYADRNNWYSALLGLRAVADRLANKGGHCIMINSDLVAAPAWIELTVEGISQSSSSITLACDAAVANTPEAMRINTADSRFPGVLQGIGKHITGVAEFVGLLSLDSHGCREFIRILARFEQDDSKTDAWYEEAIDDLSNQVEVQAIQTPAGRWVEVDTLDDLRAAAAMIDHRVWGDVEA